MTVLDFEQARHLVSRAGFGPELETIYQVIELSPTQAATSLLNSSRTFMLPQPSAHSFNELRTLRKAGREQKQAANKLLRKDIKNIKAWAIAQALKNPNALQEKMVWFWHNHFTSSSQKSRRSADLLMGQTLLIRHHALGNFADLLRAIVYDPLMLIYLDGISNVKGKPNENFARELLELFTLGEGHYTEQDIKEVARAFTGWRINGKTGAVVKRKKRYDDGSKTVFGKTGNFDSDAIIELLLQHPRTAEWIAEKMWYAFVSIARPDPATIQRWANTFRTSGYDISALLHEVLTSQAFWDEAYRGTLLKSPLDWVVGTLRVLDLEDQNLPLPTLHGQLRRMGQDLYTPPNVKGWPGGLSWVSDFTLPIRQQFVRRLTRGSNNQRAKQHDAMMMQSDANQKKNLRMQALPTLPSEHWESWLLAVAAVTDTQKDDPRQRLQAILLDPSYQLK